jgi:hypothetical protein
MKRYKSNSAFCQVMPMGEGISEMGGCLGFHLIKALISGIPSR